MTARTRHITADALMVDDDYTDSLWGLLTLVAVAIAAVAVAVWVCWAVTKP